MHGSKKESQTTPIISGLPINNWMIQTEGLVPVTVSIAQNGWFWCDLS